LEEKEFQRTGETTLLIRKPATDVIQQLTNAYIKSFSEGTAKPTLLYGNEGSGKSANMQHIVYWARKSGWLVLNIKSMLKLSHSGGIIEKSKFFPGLWDQPFLAVRILSAFLDVHQDKLKTVRLKTGVTLPKFEGNTLFDLVEFGAALHEMASTVFYHLVKELTVSYEYPILFAIDGYNVVYNYNQAFRDPDDQRYFPRKLQNQYLTMVSPFKDIHLKNPLINGCVVLSTTCATTLRHFDVSKIKKQKTNLIEVSPFDEYDFNKIMDHWQRTKYVYADTTRETRKILNAICDGRGYELSRFCQSL